MLTLIDGIEEARAAIGEKTKATFDNVHASFTERLSATIANDEAFIQKVTETANTLSAPLTEEKLQTESCLGGKPITEVFKVGDRVAKFKKIIEMEEAKLKDLWKQWDEVQNEYVELGKEVFGREVFNDDSTGEEKGFRKDMELLKLEYGTRVEELVEEIGDIGPDILKRMKASEKVCLFLFDKIYTDNSRNWTLPRRRSRRDFSKHCYNLFDSLRNIDHHGWMDYMGRYGK